MLVILGVFSVAYTVRGYWDIAFGAKIISFEDMILDLLMIELLGDFVPLMPLLIFHYRNFRDKKDYVDSQDAPSVGFSSDDEGRQVNLMDYR